MTEAEKENRVDIEEDEQHDEFEQGSGKGMSGPLDIVGTDSA